MKFIVALDYKRFEFNSLKAAGEFALAAKIHSVSKDLSVELNIEEDPEDQEDQEDQED